MSVKFKFKSLEDYIISTPLNVDGSLNDGWGAYFPVKGCEIEATVLFADIASFSRRTKDLSPTETLIFVNNFFCWITAEALIDKPCIVDKYIGDEIMLIFSKDFGSEDPFIDALQTARMIAEYDQLGYCPHMGIASGLVTAGFVGTPIKYNCSVFGLPVTIASRCASIRSVDYHSSSITFPSSLWQDYIFEDIFPSIERKICDGGIYKRKVYWKLLDERTEPIRNLGEIKVREIVSTVHHISDWYVEDRAKKNFEILKELGHYRQYKK